MAEVLTISLEGFGELEKALKSIGPTSARRVGAKAMRAGAKLIVDRAKVLVPVDTGRLQDAITAEPVRTDVDKELKAVIGIERPISSRAHFIEFGTSRARAQPFLRPAMDAEWENAIAVMGAEMWKGIEAAANAAPKGKK